MAALDILRKIRAVQADPDFRLRITYDDGQAIFLDTPGTHKPTHRMNVRMVDAAVEGSRQADFLTLITDATDGRAGRGERFILDQVQHATAPIALVINKIDLVARQSLLPMINIVVGFQF